MDVVVSRTQSKRLLWKLGLADDHAAASDSLSEADRCAVLASLRKAGTDSSGLALSQHQHQHQQRVVVVGDTMLYRHLAATTLQPTDIAVDVGCSYGVSTALMASVSERAFGVDLSEHCIASCQSRYADVPNLTFSRADILHPHEGKQWAAIPHGEPRTAAAHATVLYVDIGGNRGCPSVVGAVRWCRLLMPRLRLIVIKSKELRGFLLRMPRELASRTLRSYLLPNRSSSSGHESTINVADGGSESVGAPADGAAATSGQVSGNGRFDKKKTGGSRAYQQQQRQLQRLATAPDIGMGKFAPPAVVDTLLVAIAARGGELPFSMVFVLEKQLRYLIGKGRLPSLVMADSRLEVVDDEVENAEQASAADAAQLQPGSDVLPQNRKRIRLTPDAAQAYISAEVDGKMRLDLNEEDSAQLKKLETELQQKLRREFNATALAADADGLVVADTDLDASNSASNSTGSVSRPFLRVFAYFQQKFKPHWFRLAPNAALYRQCSDPALDPRRPRRWGFIWQSVVAMRHFAAWVESVSPAFRLCGGLDASEPVLEPETACKVGPDATDHVWTVEQLCASSICYYPNMDVICKTARTETSDTSSTATTTANDSNALNIPDIRTSLLVQVLEGEWARRKGGEIGMVALGDDHRDHHNQPQQHGMAEKDEGEDVKVTEEKTETEKRLCGGHKYVQADLARVDIVATLEIQL